MFEPQYNRVANRILVRFLQVFLHVFLQESALSCRYTQNVWVLGVKKRDLAALIAADSPYHDICSMTLPQTPICNSLCFNDFLNDFLNELRKPLTLFHSIFLPPIIFLKILQVWSSKVIYILTTTAQDAFYPNDFRSGRAGRSLKLFSENAATVCRTPNHK